MYLKLGILKSYFLKKRNWTTFWNEAVIRQDNVILRHWFWKGLKIAFFTITINLFYQQNLRAATSKTLYCFFKFTFKILKKYAFISDVFEILKKWNITGNSSRIFSNLTQKSTQHCDVILINWKLFVVL